MIKDFTKKLLKEIEEKKITPKPKWEFILKNFVIWASGILSVIVGGVAISIIIFVNVNGDWGMSQRISGNLLNHTLAIIPFIWILFFVIFTYFSYYNLRHTKGGYKYKLTSIVVLSILSSFILGGFFYSFGISHAVDYTFGQHFSGYKSLMQSRQELWTKPEKGLLSGMIISVSETNDFVLEDKNKKIWNIIGDKLKQEHHIILNNSDRVDIIGIQINEDTFKVCALRPTVIEGENSFIKHKLGISMHKMRIIKDNFRKENIDERNIFEMRNIICESGTITPQKMDPKNITN